jgi:peptidoglycan/xylan/chitin deacetylase (PgdA/CDA1 family)
MTNFVMYHYIKDFSKKSKYSDIKGLEVKLFEEQIKSLKKRFEIISIEQFLTKDYDSKIETCVLTFDDGYKEHYTLANEILNKYKLKGAFYVPVDVIEKKTLLDVNKVHILLSQKNENILLNRLKFHYNKINEKNNLDKIIESIDSSSRYDNKETIILKKLLQTILPDKTRFKILNLLMSDFIEDSETDIANKWYINKSEIKEMISNGMHFGSHGKSHLRFSHLVRKDQENEITSSFKFLDKMYENKIYQKTICYPYGDFNSDTLELLTKNNIDLGLTTIPKKFNNEMDMRIVPRFDTNDF